MNKIYILQFFSSVKILLFITLKDKTVHVNKPVLSLASFLYTRVQAITAIMGNNVFIKKTAKITKNATTNKNWIFHFEVGGKPHTVEMLFRNSELEHILNICHKKHYWKTATYFIKM